MFTSESVRNMHQTTKKMSVIMIGHRLINYLQKQLVSTLITAATCSTSKLEILEFSLPVNITNIFMQARYVTYVIFCIRNDDVSV